VLVAVSTRVAAGAVAPLYTGGGAVDLVAGGAQLAGTLRPGQTRIAVLAALLSATTPAAAPASRDASAADAGGAPVPAPVPVPDPVVARHALERILAAAPQNLPASELYLVDRVGK
jgi:L-asparaginase